MKFETKLKKSTREQLWSEYCGFLDLSLKDYMFIQHRLLKEQLEIWSECELAQSLLRGNRPKDYKELKEALPLTSYKDYAEILLAKKSSALPGDPVIWIQTTWEGGLRPIKVAPYTRDMLDTYRHNLCTLTMLATSTEKGEFVVHRGDSVLYGGASLPYATGLIPSLLEEDIHFKWLPENASPGSGFSDRIKTGFKEGLKEDIEFFFGMGAVANYITQSFSKISSGGGGGGLKNVSVAIAGRFLKAKYLCKRDGRGLLPKDIFHLNGFVYSGPDSRCYRENLAEAWGVVPIEIAAGTESTCIASETWQKNGMVFFPNACFYEFIPESEVRRNIADPHYRPRTCLMDEVQEGENYELVISVFHGGAFMRYRIGDMYRCTSAGKNELPRFLFQDRVPTVIDIAGFTRITEQSVKEVLQISKAPISEWLARKEYDAENRPFFHMYVEIDKEMMCSSAATSQVLVDHLSAYFRYFDSDYSDLKKILSIEPLQITILKAGLIEAYQTQIGRKLQRINTDAMDISDMLAYQEGFINH